jgi:outer membrane lipoprotein-sorting protein
MRKSILMLLLTAFTSVTFAQKDAKSQEILKGVSAKYKSYKSISAAFKVMVLDAKDKSTQTQTGNIVMSGNKYNLNITGQQIISDGKSSWTYLKDANEVQINDASTKTDGITPTSIFTVYENGFDSKFVEEKTMAGKAMQLIDLTPLDKKKPYFKIQLQVNKADKTISGASILNNNGTKMVYSVTKFSPDVAVNDAMFTFDTKKFPGVEVVDLR